jgi:hypothetical protein
MNDINNKIKVQGYFKYEFIHRYNAVEAFEFIEYLFRFLKWTNKLRIYKINNNLDLKCIY